MADQSEVEKAPEVEKDLETDEQKAKRREKLETHSSSHHTAGTAHHTVGAAASSDQNEDG